jgi:hypothetical protein
MKVITEGHLYHLKNFETVEVNNADVPEFQSLQFIHKEPVDDKGTLKTVANGTTNEEVLEMLIDRMKYLQAKFPCKENACCITHLEEGLMWLEKRTRDRMKRGVEGKNLV